MFITNMKLQGHIQVGVLEVKPPPFCIIFFKFAIVFKKKIPKPLPREIHGYALVKVVHKK